MKQALVVLAVVLGAAGCNGGSSSAAPASLPPVASPAASASPKATPKPAAVVKPKLADQPSSAGAEAFARYWIAAVNAAHDSLDPSVLVALSAPSCKTCEAYVGSISRAAAERRSYRGGKIVVREVVAPHVSAAGATVVLTYDVPRLEVLGREGALIREVKAARNVALQFDLRRFKKGWVAREVGRL